MAFTFASSTWTITSGTETIDALYADTNNAANAFLSRVFVPLNNAESSSLDRDLVRYTMTNPFRIVVNDGATFTIPLGRQIYLLDNSGRDPWIRVNNNGVLNVFESYPYNEGSSNQQLISLIHDPRQGLVNGTLFDWLDDGNGIFVCASGATNAQININGGMLFLAGISTEFGIYRFRSTKFIFPDGAKVQGSEAQFRHKATDVLFENVEMYGGFSSTWIGLPTQTPDITAIGSASPAIFSFLSDYTPGNFYTFRNLGAGELITYDVLFRCQNSSNTQGIQVRFLGLTKNYTEVRVEGDTFDDQVNFGIVEVVQPFKFNFVNTSNAALTNAKGYLTATTSASWASDYQGVTVELGHDETHNLLTYAWDSGNKGTSQSNLVDDPNFSATTNLRLINEVYTLQPYSLRAREFSKIESAGTLSIQERYEGTAKIIDITLVDDIDVSGDKATIDAVLGWAFTATKVTITADLTSQQIYNAYKSYLLDNMSVAGGKLNYIKTTDSLSVGMDIESGALSAGGRITVADGFTYTLSATGAYPRATTMQGGSTVLLDGGPGTYDLSGWEFNATVNFNNTSSGECTVNVPAGASGNIAIEGGVTQNWTPQDYIDGLSGQSVLAWWDASSGLTLSPFLWISREGNSITLDHATGQNDPVSDGKGGISLPATQSIDLEYATQTGIRSVLTVISFTPGESSGFLLGNSGNRVIAFDNNNGNDILTTASLISFSAQANGLTATASNTTNALIETSGTKNLGVAANINDYLILWIDLASAVTVNSLNTFGGSSAIHLHALLLFDHIPTADEKRNFEGWAARLSSLSNVDLVANLPEAHPHKASPEIVGTTGGGAITLVGPPTTVTFSNIPETGTDLYIYDAADNNELASLTSTLATHELAYSANGSQIRVQIVFPAGTFLEINLTLAVGNIPIDVGAIANTERNFLNPP